MSIPCAWSHYRPALTFLGEGALLSLSGEKKVGFLARDVSRVEVEIGRLFPTSFSILRRRCGISHARALRRPRRKDRRALSRYARLQPGGPGKPRYDSIDLGPYLQDKAQTRRGLFLLRVRAVRYPRNAR